MFRTTPNFDFLRYRRLATGLSLILVIAAVVSLAVRGLNLSIEFTGGAAIEVGFTEEASVPDIRAALAAAGFAETQVQSVGSARDVLIRIGADQQQDVNAIRKAIVPVIHTLDPGAELRRVEWVGAQVGEDLTEQGGLALLLALIMIFVYVMLRFRWKFAVGAIVATLHDVIITIGFFSWFGLQFDLTVLGSVLAVLGYSLNDTVVVYDRIRDNFRSLRRGTIERIVNVSINQTLARTLLTSFTTLLVLISLLLLGGDSLVGFSAALIVGVIVGSYSTVYIATSAALWLRVAPADLIPPSRERIDALP